MRVVCCGVRVACCGVRVLLLNNMKAVNVFMSLWNVLVFGYAQTLWPVATCTCMYMSALPPTHWTGVQGAVHNSEVQFTLVRALV